MLTRDEIASWPKAELHVHLDGSIRPSTLLALEHDAGLDVLPADSLEGLELSLRGIDDAGSLEGFLAWFRYTLPLLQTTESLRRVAFELAEDAARENIRWIEVRFSPVLHTERGLGLSEITEAVLDGLASAERTCDIRTGLIICAVRGRHADASVELARVAAEYRNRGVVAFDLAGPEAGFPAKDHLQAFYHARNHLLGLTVHAGESFGPASVHQALFFCGAHRLGHGIRVVEDPALLRFVVDHRIALEICPTSNVQTRVVASYAEHPIRALADADAAITINTDNRLFSRTTLTDELWRAHTLCGLSEHQVRTAAVNAFAYAFMDWEERRELARVARQALFGGVEPDVDPPLSESIP